MSTTRLLWTLAFLGLALVSPAGAQEDAASQDPTEIFFDITNVNVVNVEVYVTDGKGRRVSGLTQDDFEVFENGQPVEISNFFAVSGGQRAAGPEPVDAIEQVPLPERDALLEPISTLPEDQRLHLIIFVDNYSLRPATRNRVLNRMNRFLREKLDREDRVMVVSYDRSLHIRQTFTSDMTRVADALEELEELSGIATLRDAERIKVLEEIDVSSDAFEATVHARAYADSIYAEMDFTLNALADHVDALSGLVGRKALLHISDGMPMVIGEDVFAFIDERFPRASAKLEAFAYDYSTRYREIVNRANAGGVTFYTLEAGGMQVHSSVSAEFSGLRSGGGLAYVDSIRSANLQAPLHMMADDTGGSAIVNTNAVEAGLDEIAEDFDNYYSLGYQAPHYGNGRYYKIKVRVKRKGLKVRHRTGYRDKTSESRMADGSIAALYFDFESNPLGANLEFGNTSSREAGHYILPVTVRVPIGKLTLAPHQKRYLGRIKISVVVMDEQGRVSPVQQQEPITISIPESDIEQAKGQLYAYDLGLAVRKGLLRIAIGVKDELSAETSFLRQTVRVAPS